MGYTFKSYPAQWVIVFICIFISVLANVRGTMFTRTLIDTYITPLIGQSDPDYGPLAKAIAEVAIFYGIGVAATFTQAKLMVIISQGHHEEAPYRAFHEHGAPADQVF
jgi:ATP-binding cassette subfamily B multidrug efflux pump